MLENDGEFGGEDSPSRPPYVEQEKNYHERNGSRDWASKAITRLTVMLEHYEQLSMQDVAGNGTDDVCHGQPQDHALGHPQEATAKVVPSQCPPFMLRHVASMGGLETAGESDSTIDDEDMRSSTDEVDAATPKVTDVPKEKEDTKEFPVGFLIRYECEHGMFISIYF